MQPNPEVLHATAKPSSTKRNAFPISDAVLLQHLLSVAQLARTEESQMLAKHFVEVAFDLLDEPVAE